MRVGLRECEEGEKECGVREIRDLARSSACRRAEDTPCTEGLEQLVQVLNLIMWEERDAPLSNCLVLGTPPQVVFCHLCSIFPILYSKFFSSNPSSEF